MSSLNSAGATTGQGNSGDGRALDSGGVGRTRQGPGRPTAAHLPQAWCDREWSSCTEGGPARDREWPETARASTLTIVQVRPCRSARSSCCCRAYVRGHGNALREVVFICTAYLYGDSQSAGLRCGRDGRCGWVLWAGRVLPRRRPARNAVTTVGTAHHRLATLKPAATVMAAARRVPGSSTRRKPAVPAPAAFSSSVVVLYTGVTVRKTWTIRHCRKSSSPGTGNSPSSTAQHHHSPRTGTRPEAGPSAKGCVRSGDPAAVQRARAGMHRSSGCRRG